jgi:hypothetical protein
LLRYLKKTVKARGWVYGISAQYLA